MRTPAAAGLPADRFPLWRKGQDRALRELLFSSDRFNLLCIPTGGGKTAIYMGHAGVDDGRQCVLTATKALQDQITNDFESMGLVDMRGRQNYICNIDERWRADQAKCTAGVYCPLMREPGGCDYYDQRRLAGQSRLVTTNYRFWLHDEESEQLGRFDTLVLDEAHRAPDEISEYAAVEVHAKELLRFGVDMPGDLRRHERPEGWASRALHELEGQEIGMTSLEKRKAHRSLTRRLARLCRLSDNDWLGSRPKRDLWRWDLIDPGALAEDLLFRGAKRIILASASVRKKTLELLGVQSKVNITEQESTFPVKRRPIYYWPVANVGRKLTPGGRREWVEAMDLIISGRGDRKGRIDGVSYRLCEEIYRTSGERSRMILHERGQDAGDVLRAFRRAKPGAVLVSPAFNTGTDFPFDQCEYQILAKMPFPDMSSPLVRVRSKNDKDYVAYVTMQNVVQSYGRGNRDIEDQCETFVVDSNFGWMRARHWDFAPRYFHVAVKTLKKDSLPPTPPQRLEPRALTGGRR